MDITTNLGKFVNRSLEEPLVVEVQKLLRIIWERAYFSAWYGSGVDCFSFPHIRFLYRCTPKPMQTICMFFQVENSSSLHDTEVGSLATKNEVKFQSPDQENLSRRLTLKFYSQVES